MKMKVTWFCVRNTICGSSLKQNSCDLIFQTRTICLTLTTMDTYIHSQVSIFYGLRDLNCVLSNAIIYPVTNLHYLPCADWPQKPFQLRVACTRSEWVGPLKATLKNHSEIPNFLTFLLSQHENIDLRKIKDGLNLLKVFWQTLRCDLNYFKGL